MSYKVIHYFTDLQDFNHPYRVGDVFPRPGMNVSEDRLKELLGSKNKQGKPLIKEVVEDKKVEKVVEKEDFSQYMNAPVETKEFAHTKTEINRMSTADLKELAKLNGIDDGLSGAEIKKAFIEKFEL